MPQDRLVKPPAQQERSSQPSGHGEGQVGAVAPGLRALIIPAQVGADAAQKRRALHGRLAGAVTYAPGWDAPEDE